MGGDEKYLDVIYDETGLFCNGLDLRNQSIPTPPRLSEAPGYSKMLCREPVIFQTTSLLPPRSTFSHHTPEQAQRPIMTETQFQPSEWMLGLNRKDKNKVLKQCERTMLCIPNEERKPLTEKEVVVALGVRWANPSVPRPPRQPLTNFSTLYCRRAIVFYDRQTDGYWVRGSDEEYQLFLKRLSERGLPGYTTERSRLEGKRMGAFG